MAELVEQPVDDHHTLMGEDVLHLLLHGGKLTLLLFLLVFIVRSVRVIKRHFSLVLRCFRSLWLDLNLEELDHKDGQTVVLGKVHQ